MLQRLLTLLCMTASVVALHPALTAATDGERVDFVRDVLPILSRSCFRCHEGREAESEVRLDQRSVLLGERGNPPLVVSGDSQRSRLWQVVADQDPEIAMPPEGPRLSAAELQTLRRWIDQGVAWDERRLPEDRDSLHWSFQPVRRPDVPANSELPGSDWSENAIDQFIAQHQLKQKLRPAEQADRRTLIRRLSLTLLGLPLSADDVRDFCADERPDAWPRLVDHMLASPLYGERWARHWLDVARWAESEGYESNHPRASAWRYRDYVVESFNQDRPFDDFIRQQIAGDEIAEYSDDNLIATGFLAAARISSNEEDKWLQRNDVNVDIVNAVGNAFLGLTIQCAQCHDHKFDPLTSRDFYSLQAFFIRGQPTPVRLPSAGEASGTNSAEADRFRTLLQRRREIFSDARQSFFAEKLESFSEAERRAASTPIAERTPEQELLARRVEVQIQVSNRLVVEAITGDGRKEYDRIGKELKELESQFQRTFAFYSPVGSPHRFDVLDALGFYPLPFDRDIFEQTRPYVMPRGDVHQIGDFVTPDWPALLDPRRAGSNSDRAETVNRQAGERSRLQLADWLTGRSNPLVARVWVNRIWAWHFGRGLVETVDDFGVRGTRPSHPELLDWLASELIDSGWSTKHIQRLILTSATWQQSSNASAEVLAADPANTWLTRWNTRRLEAEVVRDALLVWSGELNEQIGGPSVDVDDREASTRRSLYLFQKRGRPAEMQGLFDGPNECSASVGQRQVSTSPLQSLYLLNHEFCLQRARSLASELHSSGKASGELVAAAWQRVLQRSPTEVERQFAIRLLQSVAAASDATQIADDGAGQGSGESPAEPLSPLAFLCQSLMNLNEAAYLE